MTIGTTGAEYAGLSTAGIGIFGLSGALGFDMMARGEAIMDGSAETTDAMMEVSGTGIAGRGIGMLEVSGMDSVVSGSESVLSGMESVVSGIESVVSGMESVVRGIGGIERSEAGRVIGGRDGVDVVGTTTASSKISF